MMMLAVCVLVSCLLLQSSEAATVTAPESTTPGPTIPTEPSECVAFPTDVGLVYDQPELDLADESPNPTDTGQAGFAEISNEDTLPDHPTSGNIPGVDDYEYGGDDGLVVALSTGFSQSIQEYLDSNATVGSRRCITETLSKLNDATASGDVSRIGVYVPCIVDKLKKANQQEIKRIMYGETINKYKEFMDELEKESFKNPQDLEKIIELLKEIIEVLKKLKQCTKNPINLNNIQKQIDAMEKDKKVLELKIKYKKLRDEIVKESAKNPPDLNKLVDLYEQIIEVLKKLKDCIDDKATKDSIDKEIKQWEQLKCDTLKRIYLDLKKKEKAEAAKRPQDLKKIVEIQNEMVEVLKKYLKCCAKTPAEKAKIQDLIDEIEKIIKINELKIKYQDIVKKMKEELAKPQKDLDKLVELYDEVIEILKKLRDLHDDQATTDKIQKEIDEWVKIKCRLLKDIYKKLTDELKKEYMKNPPDLPKALELEKKIVEILKKILKCYAKNQNEKNQIQAEIDARDKNISILELQIEYNKLADKYVLECGKNPPNKAEVLKALKEMLANLEATLKLVSPAHKKAVQDKIDTVKNEIKKYE